MKKKKKQVDEYPIRYIELNEGDIIELGGVKYRVGAEVKEGDTSSFGLFKNKPEQEENGKENNQQ